MTCPLDSSASISKDEPISVFCANEQCENIAFACDGYSNVPNNDGIVEDSFENEVPRVSQVNRDNSFRSDVCRSDESNSESFHFDVFQSDDREIEFSRSDVCRSDDRHSESFHFDVFQSDDREIEFSRSDVCRSDDRNNVGFRFDVFQSDDKEIEFSRSDVCRSDDSNNVGFRFDVFQSDDKEIEVSRSDVYRSDDSNNLGFRFDVFQSDDKEIEFSRFDACPSDGSKNVSLRLDIDSDDAEVFSAYRDDQEFLVDSGQNSETSPSCKVTSEPSEPDVLHSDALERVGIGPKREAHNLCNTDCSDEGPQYTYTAADVTIAETHVDIDGVIPQIASMEETPSPSQDTCNSTPPGLPPDSLYVHGIIQNTPSFMLVDTGASVTAVSSSLFARISPPVHLDPAPLPYIRTVSGEHLPVQGIAKLTFIFGDVSYSFESLVIDQLTYPVVLGRDFLLSLGSVIDMQNHTLTFLGQEPISLHSNRLTRSSQTDEHVTVHAHATYILPPLTESVIPVYPKRLLPTGTTGLIEPSSKLLTRYQIGGATQLVSLSEENTFPFRLLNPTSRPITIYRCSTLGSFTPAASEMSVITTEDNSDASAPSKCDPSDQNETDVPLDLSDSTLTPPEKAQLLSLINEYRDNFATSPEELGRTGLVTHKIDTGDQPPIRQRPYRVSHQQRTIIEEHVTDMLNRGIIQPSVSPWASPVVLVKKKDNTDRFCVDFRRLNAVTRKDSYPLPRIDDALDALNGTRYFSTMDLMSGYWQVEMDPESREHTAFTTYGGLYEFLVMPFGLTNAPSTYQRLMECVLRNLTYKICLIYLDDILVYSKTFSDHLLHLRQVFERLRAANLKLKPSKCRFACHRVHYLGHVVSAAGIAPDEDKIEAVRDFPRPHNVKTTRSFLGLANYYRRFVKDFAKIAAPLNNLLRKQQKFVWTDSCDIAFQTLKEALISAPILAFPDFTAIFYLYTDASTDGLGATLGQLQNGKEVVIAYAGRDLNPAERNYSTTEREALGVIFGIKKFEPYLYGRKFILYTDHHSLKWLMNISDCTGRLARWSLRIQQHDFEIRHRPGTQHGNADALSRRSYDLPVPTLSAYDIPGVPTARIRDAQRRDPDLADLITYLENWTLPADNGSARRLLLTVDDYFLSPDGLLFHLWTPPAHRRPSTVQQLVIPTAMRYEILTRGHDDPTAAHFGTTKTYEKLRTRYYWRKMFSDVQHWCRSCADCAMRKTPRNRHKAPLLPIPVESAFERVAVDAMGPFPPSTSGKRYVIVFTDYLTKWTEAFAVPTIGADVVARLLVEELLPRHGAPRTLLSDRGSNFLSTLVKEVCRLLNTKKLNTTAYHPQTDGLVERFNNTLAESISMYVSTDQKDWDNYIPSILFAYRVFHKHLLATALSIFSMVENPDFLLMLVYYLWKTCLHPLPNIAAVLSIN